MVDDDAFRRGHSGACVYSVKINKFRGHVKYAAAIFNHRDNLIAPVEAYRKRIFKKLFLKML